MADTDVTTEQLQAGAGVASAGIEAAGKEPTPAKARPAAKRAMRAAAERVQIELTDEHLEMIAAGVVDQMEARGAFDAPPERVTAPHPPAAAGEQPAVAAVPAKTSFAERFRQR
jgi:hypothetical protein